MMKELELTAEIENLEQVLELLDQDLEAAGISREDQFTFHIVVEEIYSNIAFYAYPNPPGIVKIGWSIDRKTGRVTIRFRDRGIPYDPLQKEDPDISLPAGEREAGGLGIYMVKEMMDVMEYQYSEGYNVLTVQKTLG